MSEDVIVLRRPEQVGKSSIGLHLLVKNGASVVGRLLDNVGPYLSEVVAVLNDCTDKTLDVLLDKTIELDLPIETVEVTSSSHPQFYLLDVPETYRVGRSLCGEVYEGPFTGDHLLADWAAARNLGWSAGRHLARWKLFLDADDVVDDPECLPGLAELLDQRGVEVISSRYAHDVTPGGVVRAESFRERLALNKPEIRWEGSVHENLVGFDRARVAHVEGNLRVRDLRDSSGAGIRIPGRNLKVLYHRARELDWNLSPRETIYLASEARQAMPHLTTVLVEHYLSRSKWPEEQAWACCMAGEIEEGCKGFDVAAKWYWRALRYYPSSMAALRLARVEHAAGRWESSWDAYRLALHHLPVPQFLEGPAAHLDAAKILAASCLDKLGRYGEALDLAREAAAKLPKNLALADFVAGLEKKVRRGRG